MRCDRDENIGFQSIQSRYLWFFETEFIGGDLDEMIYFQRIKSRNLWYFKRNSLELVMYGYKHLRRDDLNENDNFE